MRYIKHLFILLFIIVSLNEKASADNFTSNKTGNNFIIQREMVLKAKSIRYDNVLYVRDFVVKHGATITNKKPIKSITLPAITIKKVKRIKGVYGGSNAYSIEINQNNIKIQVTSQTATAESIKFLFSLLTESGGIKSFQGGTYTWSSEDFSNKSLGKKSMMASEILTLYTELNNMSKGSTTELIVVTPNDWMVESKILEDILGTKEIYSQKNGYANLKQIKEIVDLASNKGVNIVLAFDFSVENIPLKNNSGHSIYSVEGMRFIRAVLTELHQKCGVNEVSFKLPPESEDFVSSRFKDFINQVSHIVGVTLVKA